MTSRRLVIERLAPVPRGRFFPGFDHLVNVFGGQGDGVIQTRQVERNGPVRPHAGDLALDLHRVSFFNLISHSEYLARNAQEARS